MEKSLYKTERLQEIAKSWRKRRILARNGRLIPDIRAK
jgi:hypothetical protein